MPFPDYPCPRCNSWIDPPPGTARGEKIICPRCEEPIVWLGPAMAGSRIPALAPGNEIKSQAPANRRVASAVLGVMAVMALGGLFLALYTQETRRNRDLARVGADPRQAYLQWFPPGVTLVAVCDLGRLRETRIGADLLQAEMLSQKSFPLRKSVGFDLRELRLMGMAGSLERPLASLALLQTQRPIEEEKVREKLKAIPTGTRAGRDTWRFNLDLLPFGPTFSRLNEDTMALAILPERLDAVPPNAPGGLNNLGPKVRSLVVERIPRNAPVWLAAEGGQWESLLTGEIFPGFALNQGLPLGKDLLASLEAFALWIELDEEMRVRGEFLLSGEQDGARCEKALAAQPWGKLLQIKSAGQGKWFTIQGVVPREYYDLPRRPVGGQKKR